LVSLGIGRFDQSPLQVLIDEPLVLLSLGRWIRSSSKYAMQRFDRSFVPSALRSFIETLVFAIWDRFTGNGDAVNSVFRLVGEEPLWATQVAHLARTYGHGKRTTFHSRTQKSAADLLFVAQSPEDVSKWFSELIPHPFLLADRDFGPNVMFEFSLADGSPLLVGLVFESSLIKPNAVANFYAKHRKWRTSFQKTLAARFPGVELPSQHRRSSRIPRKAAYSIMLACSQLGDYLPRSTDYPLASIDWKNLLSGLQDGYTMAVDTLKRTEV